MTPYPRIKGKVLYDGFIEIFMCQGFEFSYKFLNVYKEGKFVRRIIK